jgi:pyrroline-5-carboxylate reductase
MNNMELQNIKIAIIGGGNIGTAITRGLLRSGKFPAENITLTRRSISKISEFSELGVTVTDDNLHALNTSDVIILAVLPSQLISLIDSLKGKINKEKHILVSVVSAFSLQEMIQRSGSDAAFVRAMPNIAVAVGESMTCLCSNPENQLSLEKVKSIFDEVGSTLIIPENLMSSATILGACGIAFFMRYIRAASQGGIQVGFHAADAQFIAAQTARGATSLLLESGNHPEREIDKVTTPLGCTIAGLNEMEHNGLSSALIKGIVLSYNEINKLK